MRKRSGKPKPVGAKPPASNADVLPEQPAPEAPIETAPPAKNPAAVALGRLGGKKGGPARAAKLTKKQLSEIGKKAARARWGKKT